ncbi:hypothetical protein BJP34_23150 [Moorena producens PAL-8-15-08-1]|uniref:Uncharacterized protein n=1 Tax=Moorena producens PAL-8-15-08-1 TaxID=1458985 RepID=A0A1D8TWB4_9CYAN|nr:hypothetical protein BJP34_23150 [Moorena producens PAL-8-15-08-1]
MNAPVRFCLLQGLEYHWVRAGSQGGFTIVYWEWGDGEMGRWGDGENFNGSDGQDVCSSKIAIPPNYYYQQTKSTLA